jgi:CheY-like chemotaxis protein
VGRISKLDNIQKLKFNQSNFGVKKTMMICDDEPDMRLLFGLVFGSKYEVIMVDSGEECIEKYTEETNRGNKISPILLNYKLGGMWGDCVARKIKECNETKIILNSAYDVNDILFRELKNGN